MRWGGGATLSEESLCRAGVAIIFYAYILDIITLFFLFSFCFLPFPLYSCIIFLRGPRSKPKTKDMMTILDGWTIGRRI